MSKKKRQVVIEDGGDVTVRRAESLSDAMFTALMSHLENPLLFVAVLAANMGSTSSMSDRYHSFVVEARRLLDCPCDGDERQQLLDEELKAAADAWRDRS